MLLEAQGVRLDGTAATEKAEVAGSLSHATKMQFNGNLMVGKAHTSQLSLEPGAASDAFRPAGWCASGPDAVA